MMLGIKCVGSRAMGMLGVHVRALGSFRSRGAPFEEVARKNVLRNTSLVCPRSWHRLGSTLTSCNLLPSNVQLNWTNGTSSIFSFMWLRDHCPQSMHETSRQRMVQTVAIPQTIKAENIAFTNEELVVNWEHGEGCYDKDAHESRFLLNWLHSNQYGFHPQREEGGCEFRVNDLLQPVEYIHPETWKGQGFEIEKHSVKDKFAHKEIFCSLLRDGLVHITNMPEGKDEIRNVLLQFGLLRRTFYANDVWELKPVDPKDVNDTAMTNIMLPPHTDCTYHQEPPGLQLFSCLQNEAIGGRSWFVDGRAIYEKLKEVSLDAAVFFKNTPLQFQCIEKNIYIKASGPVFSVDGKDNLIKFRYNNDDRAPLSGMSADTVDAFYYYLPALTEVMVSDELGKRVKIEENEMIVVDNHRCLHAREAFTGLREFVGAYIDMDHFHSQCRLHGVELKR
eukprot:m.118777 g.118777  ORF g.118777 m.118777 type:complete len:448 (+) comp9346_c2_seq1:94-1437(+)